jgi:SAM-dependent methyltransferase
MNDLARSYDGLAVACTDRLAGELAHKPFDRDFLERFAVGLPTGGLALGLGCGPGHVDRHQHDRRLDVHGIDISPAMVAIAATHNPAMTFAVGDLLALVSGRRHAAGAVGLYSIVHFSPDQLLDVFLGVHRSLRPGGQLALAFHVGAEVRHVAVLWGVAADLDFVCFPVATLAEALGRAGFVVEDCVERDPYAPDVESQTRRACVVARRGS